MAGSLDEEIMKRRLIIEGDGGSDDKKLNSLLRMFIQWCNNTEETPEERELTYNRLMNMLSHCELNYKKAHRINQMNLKEQENYKELYRSIDQDITKVEQQIVDCRQELEEARVVRKQKQEYDALAQTIMELPDCKDTTRRLEKLSKELEDLDKTKQELAAKLDVRKKQFGVVVSAVQDLSNILENQDITKVEQQIVDCRQELEEARVVRKQKQEYDALAQTIMELPDCKDTTRRLEKLSKELEDLNKTKQELAAKLDVRKKQFGVVVSAVQDLSDILEKDDENKEDLCMETS